MNERDRLIELLSRYFGLGDSYAYNLTRDKSAFSIGTMSLDDFEEFDADTVADLADHLLANGIIVPPCKVGDVVYGYHPANETTILPMVAKWIETNEKGWTVAVQYVPMAPRFYLFSDFGKTVFLTREEAEQALARRERRAMPEWISVDERLPKAVTRVLVVWEDCEHNNRIGFGTYQEHGVWYVSNEGMPIVTHWMPLPEPPEISEE